MLLPMSTAPKDISILVLHDPANASHDGPYEMHCQAWGARLARPFWVQAVFGGAATDSFGNEVIPPWWFADDGFFASALWPVGWMRLPDTVVQ